MNREIKIPSPVIQKEDKHYEKKSVIYLTDPYLKREKTCCFKKKEVLKKKDNSAVISF